MQTLSVPLRCVLFAYALLGASATAGAAEKAGEKIVGPPDTAWKDMTPAQRGKFMQEVVVPKMKPAFQTFDADDFKKFDCQTCHGKQAKARKFKMPNPDIFVLPATKEGFVALQEKKGAAMKFMAETV